MIIFINGKVWEHQLDKSMSLMCSWVVIFILYYHHQGIIDKMCIGKATSAMITRYQTIINYKFFNLPLLFCRTWNLIPGNTTVLDRYEQTVLSTAEWKWNERPRNVLRRWIKNIGNMHSILIYNTWVARDWFIDYSVVGRFISGCQWTFIYFTTEISNYEPHFIYNILQDQ